jgi:hypothetical protein
MGNEKGVRGKVEEILRLGIKPPITNYGSWTICPSELTTAILALIRTEIEGAIKKDILENDFDNECEEMQTVYASLDRLFGVGG